MRDTKTFASLSSGLLARKGAAKPAMRPQGFGSFGSSLEDLGWNDMGQMEPAAYQPDPAPLAGAAGLTPAPLRHAPEPAVVTHRRTLEQSFPPAECEPLVESPAATEATIVPLPPRRPRAVAGKPKTAFTLRLDPERHLKLRLACAVSRRSAQQLVTGALDEFLKSLPEVEALADRLPAEASGR
jgi:hypothetical protein